MIFRAWVRACYAGRQFEKAVLENIDRKIEFRYEPYIALRPGLAIKFEKGLSPGQPGARINCKLIFFQYQTRVFMDTWVRGVPDESPDAVTYEG